MSNRRKSYTTKSRSIPSGHQLTASQPRSASYKSLVGADIVNTLTQIPEIRETPREEDPVKANKAKPRKPRLRNRRIKLRPILRPLEGDIGSQSCPIRIPSALFAFSPSPSGEEWDPSTVYFDYNAESARELGGFRAEFGREDNGNGGKIVVELERLQRMLAGKKIKVQKENTCRFNGTGSLADIKHVCGFFCRT